MPTSRHSVMTAPKTQPLQGNLSVFLGCRLLKHLVSVFSEVGSSGGTELFSTKAIEVAKLVRNLKIYNKAHVYYRQ